MDSSRHVRSAVLSRYFREIRAYPVLTRDQEHRVAENAARGGCKQSLNQLVESNLSFVVKTASEYRNLGLSFEDLVNEGNMGLIKAARRFDHSKGTKFITYAIWWVRKSILKALTEYSNLVRVPTSQRKQVREIRETEESLSQELGRKPRREEISRCLDQNVSRVERVLRFSVREMSLDDRLGTDCDKPISEYLVDLTSPNAEDDLIQRESNCRLAEAIQHLSRRERTVILHRFGIAGGPALTLQELGKIMNLSRERVRQIECKAVKRLRRLFMFMPKRSVTASSRRPFPMQLSLKRKHQYR